MMPRTTQLLGFALSLSLSAAGSAHAAAPVWCGSYQSPGDNKAKFIDDKVKDGTYSRSVLSSIAAAACDKPNDAKRAEQVKKWREGYAGNLLSDKQFEDTMSAFVDEERAKKEFEEMCTKLETRAAMALDVRIRNNALAAALKCEKADREIADDYVPWVDWGNNTQLERLLIIQMTPETENHYVALMHDLKDFDFAQLAKEVESMPTMQRVLVLGMAGTVKSQTVPRFEKSMEVLLQKTPKYKDVIAAGGEGWEAWQKAYGANRDAMELGRSFEQKFFSEGKDSGVKGCGPALYQPFSDHLASKKPKDEGVAQAVANDVVDFRLLMDQMLCAAASNEPANARGFAEASMSQDWRGPRVAAVNYAVAKYQQSRSSSDADPRVPQGNALKRAYKEVRDGFERNYSHGFVNERAQVAAVKPSKNAHSVVSFSKVSYKVPLEECHEDTSKWEWVGPGQLRHPVNCRPNGQFASDSTFQAPFTVSAFLAAKLKKGNFVTWWFNSKSPAPHQAFPRATFSDPKQKKLIGYLGTSW